MRPIEPCLWFDHQAEEAATFYVSLFPRSRILSVSRFGEAAAKVAGRPRGSAMAVSFALMGRRFVALNGGPRFPFTEAVSLVVPCRDQAEVNRYWGVLSRGGEESRCGWLKDRYGLSWQVVPVELTRMLADDDPVRVNRVMAAVLGMGRIDLAAVRRAYRDATRTPRRTTPRARARRS